uniref:MCM_OB domain-containing protein n=1 Tax=Angiostrongylus cantonensis TaxID=6313 RepID=A0A0K0D1B8_ANGCA
MYYDGMVLKSVLESFVDDIAEESSELLLERPRYAYAVVVVANDHEICEANCVRQLDVEVFQTQNSIIDNHSYDSDIQRALQELTESRDLLITPRQSMLVDTSQYEVANSSNITCLLENAKAEKLVVDEVDRSAAFLKRSAVQVEDVCSVCRDQKNIGYYCYIH